MHAQPINEGVQASDPQFAPQRMELTSQRQEGT